jgi:hypothetical protein
LLRAASAGLATHRRQGPRQFSSAAVAGASAASQYLRLKEAVKHHFAVKCTTDGELEPVPDTEDRLKIRAYVVLSLSIPPQNVHV